MSIIFAHAASVSDEALQIRTFGLTIFLYVLTYCFTFNSIFVFLI